MEITLATEHGISRHTSLHAAQCAARRQGAKEATVCWLEADVWIASLVDGKWVYP